MIFPVLILIIFGVIQGALYYHARNVALSAAQEGTRAAKAENGTAGAGEQAARQFVSNAGGGQVITNLSVNATRNANQASVTVRGRPLSIVPFIGNFTVSQTAEGPVERFTAPDGSS